MRSRGLLYVDDDDAVRDSIVFLCQALGIEVETVGSGRAALQRVTPGDFSAVITDLGMPEMDGVALTREIKNVCPEIPVIVMSGWSKERVLQRFDGSITPDGVLEKPLTLGALRAVLAEVSVHREGTQRSTR